MPSIAFSDAKITSIRMAANLRTSRLCADQCSFDRHKRLRARRSWSPSRASSLPKCRYELAPWRVFTFVRTTDKACGTEVVFPSLNIKRVLPLKEPVLIECTPAKAGELAFACGMNMLKASSSFSDVALAAPRGAAA